MAILRLGDGACGVTVREELETEASRTLLLTGFGLTAFLLAVAVTAMLVPARRATRVDPVTTLGEE